MKVVDEKIVTTKTLIVELDEVVSQALVNFIGPTSISDRKEKWKINQKESESLSELYNLLFQHGFDSTNGAVYPLD